MTKEPTLEELKRWGLERYAGFEKHILNRNTHPGYHISIWPTGSSLDSVRQELRYRMPNLNYNSVLVVVISNDWMEGGWWRLQDMLNYTEKAGFTVAMEEVDDPSMMPTDAIGIMRACGAMLALDAGFEWCFMIDTDVLLEKDTLVRLLKHDRPVVYPLIIDTEQKYPDAPVCGPRLQPNTGLQPMRWSTMSAMLFNTKVFNCLDAYAWHGHDGHFAQCLAHFGHRIYVDTDAVVKVSRGPTRNPVKSWEQFWADMKKGWERRANQDRDRRPPPDYDPFGEGWVDQDGCYWAVKSWEQVGLHTPLGHNGPPIKVPDLTTPEG